MNTKLKTSITKLLKCIQSHFRKSVCSQTNFVSGSKGVNCEEKPFCLYTKIPQNDPRHKLHLNGKQTKLT